MCIYIKSLELFCQTLFGLLKWIMACGFCRQVSCSRAADVFILARFTNLHNQTRLFFPVECNTLLRDGIVFLIFSIVPRFSPSLLYMSHYSLSPTSFSSSSPPDVVHLRYWVAHVLSERAH